VRQFAQANGEGSFCIPLPLNNTGIAGIKDGANVTIQIVYAADDGNLYQVCRAFPSAAMVARLT
jgi:hypothetical protein